jgi:putative two-component system response regulator
MHHRPTVLLVHDDADARVRFGSWLSAGGYRCLIADDSASALRFAGRTTPDVAVIDIGRRDPDRLWLAGRLRERATPVGVVLLSGESSSAHAAAADRLGVSGVLVRPRGPEELLAAVQRAASWRDHEEARALDTRAAVMATVAARQAAFMRAVGGARTAGEVFAAVRGTFDQGEPALLAHALRVAQGAGALARALHLSRHEVADVAGAALLHDLGKLALPEPVLLGAAPVGDSEMEALLEHQSRTLDLVGDGLAFRGIATLLASVCERWDGSGCPLGLAGSAIPLGARIIAVADAFDAASAACGSDAQAAQHVAGRAALAREAGVRLDPDLARVYLHLVDEPSCS